MKAFRPIIIVGIFLSTFAFTFAQSEENTEKQQIKKTEPSLLWKIEGKDLKEPSYLFGTIHMICEENFEMKEKVSDAMRKTKQSYLEMNLADPNLAEETKKYMMSEESISSQLSKEDALYLNGVLQEKLQTSLVDVDYIKGGIILRSIMQMNASCKIVSFEEQVIKNTLAENKQVSGLSSIQEQYSFLDKIFDVKELANYLRMLEKPEMKESMEKMNEAYLSENIEQINDLLKDYAGTNPEQYHQLTTVRNQLWFSRMPEIMKEKATFFAVGAGHLSGNQGLIALLRQAGYKVSPIYN